MLRKEILASQKKQMESHELASAAIDTPNGQRQARHPSRVRTYYNSAVDSNRANCDCLSLKKISFVVQQHLHQEYKHRKLYGTFRHQPKALP